MVIYRQSRLQGTPQSFDGNLSEELFYRENYFYIKYGQLWHVSVWVKNLKSLSEESLTPCHSSFSDGIICGHYRLLYKLLQINVGGNFYDLIKNLYYNSTGSVRIGSQTLPLQYARGVRQGCGLSLLVFNVYINDLPYSFKTILSYPFVLPNGNKLM